MKSVAQIGNTDRTSGWDKALVPRINSRSRLGRDTPKPMVPALNWESLLESFTGPGEKVLCQVYLIQKRYDSASPFEDGYAEV